MEKDDDDDEQPDDNDDRVSLHPLDPEDALRGLLKVDPEEDPEPTEPTDDS